MLLTIRWKNAHHFLIGNYLEKVFEVPDSQIVTWQYYKTKPEDLIRPRASIGELQYDILDNIKYLCISLSFVFQYNNKSYEILNVKQLLKIEKPIVAIDWVQFPVEKNQYISLAEKYNVQLPVVYGKTLKSSHPLVDLTFLENEIKIDISSLFVDITQLWDDIHGKTDYALKWYKEYGDKKKELRVLAFTGGSPLLWFVIVPEICKTAGGNVAAHIFFRPLGANPINNISTTDITGITLPNQQVIDKNSKPPKTDYQYNIVWRTLCRYLLAPSQKAWFLEDKFKACYPQQNDFTLSASLELALVKSNKRIILFLPQTSLSKGYGEALTPKLTGLIKSAFNLLKSHKGVLDFNNEYSLVSQIGVSGYSQGGDAVLNVLNSNVGGIKEVFLFQPNGLNSGKFNIALQNNCKILKKVVICIISQYGISQQLIDLKQTLEKIDKKVNVYLMPDASKKDFYRFFPLPGQNDWIRYVFRKYLYPETPTEQEKKDCLDKAGYKFSEDEMKKYLSEKGFLGTKWDDFMHQFVIFGGQVFPYQPNTKEDTNNKKTFFQECLEYLD